MQCLVPSGLAFLQIGFEDDVLAVFFLFRLFDVLFDLLDEVLMHRMLALGQLYGLLLHLLSDSLFGLPHL